MRQFEWTLIIVCDRRVPDREPGWWWWPVYEAWTCDL
jgi:hypothetical protein